jgi:hypothetical protein
VPDLLSGEPEQQALIRAIEQSDHWIDRLFSFACDCNANAAQ